MGHAGLYLQWQRWILVLILWLGLPGASLPAGDGLPLNVGYTEFPPLEYRDNEGRPAGEFIELTRQVAAEAGYDLNFIHIPVTRVYLYLQQGKIDLWPGLASIPALADDVVESINRPIEVELSLWRREETPPVERFEDLYGHKIIVIAGYTYGGLADYLENSDKASITAAPGHQAAVDMLLRNRASYLLDYRLPIEEILEGYPAHNLEQSVVRHRYAAWLFSKQNPRTPQLRNAFDEAYNRLVQRGEVIPLINAVDQPVFPGFPELSPRDRS
ncbi:MAG: transporter substrate-binding domain-containing protein [Marinobacter sp.]|uniref:substrate-binding periplasmic protein n=1 Tax=Marinobacter sp. TaxID=50741 RepID=UPI00349FF87C